MNERGASGDSDRIRRPYSQAQRLLRIYLALANARSGLTVAQLREQTGVTRRTISREIGRAHV